MPVPGAARAQQHHPHRLRRIAAARHQRLQMLVQHDHRRRHEFACCHSRACPRNVASPVDWFSCASAAITCAGPLPPSVDAALSRFRPGFRRRRDPRTRPGRLHIAVRKGFSRLPAIHPPCPPSAPGRHLTTRGLTVRCSHSPVALIHRFAGRGAQRRLRLRARLCRRLLKQHHMPIQLRRLHIGRASPLRCGPRLPCSLSVPLVPCSLFCAAAGGAKLASSRSPLAVCRAPVAVVCSISAWPTPISVRSTEPAPNVPVTSSAVILRALPPHCRAGFRS